MGKITSVTRFFNNVGRLFNSSAKKTNQVVTTVRRTTGNFNRATHTGYLEREFCLNGEWRMVRTEYRTLADGTKVSATKVFPKINGQYNFGAGSISRNRTRSLSVEQSILVGKRVTINKLDADTMSFTGRESTFVKDYDEAGMLWHKAYSLKNSHGYSEAATADRMYASMPFNSGIDDMLVHPSEVNNFKLSNKFGNNYTNFIDEGSKYSNALKTSQLMEAESAMAAEAVFGAHNAKLSALYEAEAAGLAASRPRANIGKLFPEYNIDDLKVVEKVAENGKITRYYFRPETGKGNRIPIIKTTDYHGIHCEWINGTSSADKIFFKQVGNEAPYIVVRSGNSTFVRQTKGRGEKVHHVINQYYKDGVNKARFCEYTTPNLNPNFNTPSGHFPTVETTIKNPRFGNSDYQTFNVPEFITYAENGSISSLAVNFRGGSRGYGHYLEEADDVNKIFADIRTKSLKDWNEFGNVDKFFLPFS